MRRFSSSNKLVRGLLLIGVLFTAFLPVGQTLAQGDGEIKLTAVSGFDGLCQNQEWVPVRVTVENTGADRTVTARISYQESGNGGTTSTETTVELPANSRKSFFLYIFADGTLRNFKVEAMQGSKVLQKVSLPANCNSSDVMLVGVISDNPASFDIIRDVDGLRGGMRVAQISLADLPSQPSAWGALDGLVLSNTDTGNLSEAQYAALQTWLGSGGTLFVTGGTRWQGTVAGVQALLPIEVQSIASVGTLNSLSAYTQSQSVLQTGTGISVGVKRVGAQVLIEQEGIPILSRMSIGQGAVYFFAADPSVQPLNNWDGMTRLYEQTLGVRPPVPLWMHPFDNRNNYGSSVESALGAIPELSMPSILYVCGLLGFYIALIGPLNFFVLRRIKRRELAWVSVPALVILFSCAFYGLGFSFRGVTPLLNRLIVVQAWDALPQARASALVGVYSPIRREYDLSLGQGFLPRMFDGSSGDLQGAGSWTVEQGGGAVVVPAVRVEISGLKSFISEGTLPALPISHSLKIDLGIQAPIIKGTIQNNSEFTLNDALLVTPAGWRRVGDLKAGGILDVSSALSTLGGSSFYEMDAMSIMNIDYLDVQANLELARQQAFLQSTLVSQGYGYAPVNKGNWGIFLIGWLDRSDLPVSIADRRFDTVDTVMYIHSLQPSIESTGNTLTLPPSFFTWESSLETASPYGAWDIPSTGYVLRFTPAVPISFKTVKELKVNVASSSGGTLPTVHIWNISEKTWVRLQLQGGALVVSNPSRFVFPNGEVRLRITTNQSFYVDVDHTVISMVVEQ